MLSLAVLLAVTAGAVAQAVSGVGFGLVCGPLLVAALGPRDGVRLSVLLSMAVNLGVLAWAHREVAWSRLPLLLTAAGLSTPLLAWALTPLPARTLQVLAGATALAGALALAVGLSWPAARGRTGTAAAGVVSAAMNVVAGIGGPAVVLHAANAGWPAAQTRATLQVYFLCLNTVAVLSLGTPAVGGGLVAAAAAGLVLGLGAGALVARRVGERSARGAALALAGAGGAVVLARALG